MKMRVTIIASFLLLTLESLGFAGSSLRPRRELPRNAGDPPPAGIIASATPGTFTEAIDHTDASVGTFQQRYYINTSVAAGPTAPVILLICGEYTCDPNLLLTGLDEGGVDEYARELKANLVILEHRYYGQSQPFTDLSTEHLKYLTTDQAIEDLVSFRQFVQAHYGLTGKWVSIGGSYAGILSSFFRFRHPELDAGALGSSSPVFVKVEFPEYDRHAAAAISPACADQVRSDVAYFEQGLTDSTRMALIRSEYQAPTPASDTDVLDAIESVAAGAIQYSQKDAFCAAIQVADSPTGWLDYAKATGAVGPSLVTDLSDIHDFDDGSRQWTYQTCTEYGYFQTAYSDPNQSLLPRRVDLDHELEPCRTAFNITSLPDVNGLLTRYTQPLLANSSVTNILFTNAQDDPWTELGVTPQNTTLHAGLSAFEYSVYAHHGDLKPTVADIPASVLQAKNLFRQLVAQWLDN